MISFFRYFARKKGAWSAIFLIQIFTFIPASILLWMEEERHYLYYIFAGGVALIIGWIVIETGKEFIFSNFKKDFLLPANICFFAFYLVFVFGVTEFYLSVAKMFAPFEINYIGPNRLLAFFVVIACYNMFLIPKMFKKS